MGLRNMIATVLIGLCTLSAPAWSDPMQLSVSVTYRERILLPPDAVLELELLDVSRADAATTRLSSMRFKLDRVPFEAALSYDDALIDDRMSYVVAARILSGGNVIFRTTSAYPVLTRDAGTRADLVLQSMPGPTQSTEALTGVTWAAFEIAGRLLVADDPPTIAFEPDGRFSFFGGCNRFAGEAQIGEGTIAFPEAFAGTRMACTPQRETLEQDFLDAVSQSVGFQSNGDTIVLTNDAGVTTLRLRRAPL